MAKKKYTLTDEHRAQLKPWADRWIENGLSTKPMDDNDREHMRLAIRGLYESANLTPPPDNRIIFVPSPFVARFAGGFAASIWWNLKKGKSGAATYDATDAATYAATYEATYDATYEATDAATYEATYAATYEATGAATRAATDAATDEATRAATDAATRAATDAATYAATYEATDAATDAATYETTGAATYDATYEATDAATRAATYAATYEATGAATRAATDAATRAATDAATDAATYETTGAATYDATYEATDAATRAATYAATRAATYAATRAATYAATYDVNKKWFTQANGFVRAGIRLNIGSFGFQCAAESWRMYQGGNFWSGWAAFLSFFRHVVKLPLDYSKFEFWEKATIHGSFRIMHPEFCMISDRPRILKFDDQGRPHCENGPYIQWADGMGLFCWHGVRVPEYWIMQKHLIKPEELLGWENAEERRAGFEILGWNNVLDLLGAQIVDKDEDPTIGILYKANHEALGGECKFLKMYCPTGRWFAEPVPPDMETALQANAWGWELDKYEYKPSFQA